MQIPNDNSSPRSRLCKLWTPTVVSKARFLAIVLSLFFSSKHAWTHATARNDESSSESSSESSGESSGELDEMLVRVSHHMQQDVEMIMGVLLSLFGPFMLLMMGGGVFVIVMAILLPIINLNQLVG